MEHFIKLISQLSPVAQTFAVIGLFTVIGIAIYSYFKMLRSM